MTTLREIFGFGEMTYDRSAGHRWPDYFGLEFEVENCDNPDPFGSWATHIDGSLRQGIEFVLEQPQGGANLEKALTQFYNRGLKYNNGPRTSTHIHINAKDMTVEQLRVMILAVYLTEDTLFNVVGEQRKWAGYATGLQEMDQVRLRKILSSSDMFELMGQIAPGRNQERYYGFNVASVKRHGTVEFRHFPGGPTLAEVRSWLDLVWSLKAIALNVSLERMLNLNTGQEILDLLEGFLPKEWMDHVRRQEKAETLFHKYSEVAALCTTEEMDRRDRIIFLTRPLVRFINKALFEEAGQKAFIDFTKRFTVVGFADFQMFLEESYMADAKNKKKPVTKKAAMPALERPVVYADVGRRDRAFEELLAQPAIPPRQNRPARRNAEDVRQRAERIYGRPGVVGEAHNIDPVQMWYDPIADEEVPTPPAPPAEPQNWRNMNIYNNQRALPDDLGEF